MILIRIGDRKGRSREGRVWGERQAKRLGFE